MLEAFSLQLINSKDFPKPSITTPPVFSDNCLHSSFFSHRFLTPEIVSESQRLSVPSFLHHRMTQFPHYIMIPPCLTDSDRSLPLY